MTAQWIQTAIDLIGTVITIAGILWKWVDKLHKRLDKIEAKQRNIEMMTKDALLVASESLGMRPHGRRWYDREAQRVRSKLRNGDYD